ncbi:GspH/FimT family pseudopilin [Lacimicrobium alkaliphilum]|uniref:Type II secretion system protein H n=1 Tax=Lacimicrobium alkaliphilum TaxID=1526571 RepID=A0ABQ1RH83_9ALTE|nr:GspH/FimT family pseudopilin [Lacimicrobium alkaliphilum]GGD66416.1 hypothetical protein GCM10011357_22090 [Lacimicrobium alkaliphilum]
MVMDKPSFPSRYSRVNHTIGVSLIELLIAVTVISLTISIGAPALIESFKSQRVKGAAQTGYFMLQYARSVAISRGTDITLDFVSGSNWCVGISDSGPCDCSTANSCTIDEIEFRLNAAQYRNVKMNNVTFSAGATVIDGRHGMATGHAGALELTDGENTMKLVMSNLARVRICTETGNSGGYPSC